MLILTGLFFSLSADNLIDQNKVAKSQAKAIELEKKVNILLTYLPKVYLDCLTGLSF